MELNQQYNQLTVKNVIGDFIKKSFLPGTYFFLILMITGELFKIEFNSIDWWAYIFLISAIPLGILNLRRINVGSPIKMIISFFIATLFCVPKVIWMFIKMIWYAVLTIINLIRIMYYQINKKKSAAFC